MSWNLTPWMESYKPQAGQRKIPVAASRMAGGQVHIATLFLQQSSIWPVHRPASISVVNQHQKFCNRVIAPSAFFTLALRCLLLTSGLLVGESSQAQTTINPSKVIVSFRGFRVELDAILELHARRHPLSRPFERPARLPAGKRIFGCDSSRALQPSQDFGSMGGIAVVFRNPQHNSSAKCVGRSTRGVRIGKRANP